tara:strand:+ start:289 stop:1590 length:1302 start_codon:yes stop_codon:yes gene_type:complete
MLLRELTHKNKQLDEAIFTAAMLTTVATTLLTYYAAGVAFDYLLSNVKNWLNELEIKNFKPTGDHMPDKTQATVKGKRYVYVAADDAWYERKGKSKTIQFVKGKDGKPKKVKFNADTFRKALIAKKVVFLDKTAVLVAMQNSKINNVPAGVAKQFAQTGDTLDDLIAREKQGRFAKAYNRYGKRAVSMFGTKALSMLNFVLPVWCVYNVCALKATYQRKLQLGKDEGHIDTLTNKRYDKNSYDRDIARLRSTTTTYVATYIATLGPVALATGFVWTLLLFKKNRLEKVGGPLGKLYKAGKITVKALSSGIFKLGAVGAGGIAVASTVNPQVANGIGGAVADVLMKFNIFSPGESPGETVLEAVADYFDVNFDRLMINLGFGTATDNEFDKNYDKDDVDDSSSSSSSNKPNSSTQTGPKIMGTSDMSASDLGFN